jgi:hypothetical protein
MFYIRSMMENQQTGVSAPEGAAFGPGSPHTPPTPGGPGGRKAETEKRIDGVEPAPRKRGGQPGNGNAVKTGRYTAQVRGARKRVRAFLRNTKATLSAIEARLASERKGTRR